MSNYYCEYCGAENAYVSGLTRSFCLRHPDGPKKGKHKLYQGNEKPQYTCQYCGSKYATILILTTGFCLYHPNGPNKGRHVPVL